MHLMFILVVSCSDEFPLLIPVQDHNPVGAVFAISLVVVLADFEFSCWGASVFSGRSHVGFCNASEAQQGFF